ncbi:MAG: zf-HC2 domain-containing protein [Elusimicrobia bacterium]|nr:zf-HC2 domain-containing protein [Elusimicrobiota bacterium]
MKLIKCSELKKDLYFYIKGEVELPLKSEIEKHISDCPACQKLLKEFSGTLKVVDKVEHTVPQKNWYYFSEKVLGKIHAKRQFNFLKPAIVVALSFFFFILGYKYYQLKNYQKVNISYENDDEKLVSYLTDFSIPELYQ